MQLNKDTLDLLRARECLTVLALAKKAGISQSTINTGYKKEIDPVPVGKIAKALNVDVKDIIIEQQR